MADDLTPGQVRARQFDIARRGYERGQVDAYLAQLADQLADLHARLDASGGDLAIGIDDEQALALELHTIGAQVAEILESARSAAEGMRTRASEDASSWRSDAEATSSSLMADAGEQSQSMRASAWNEGSSLLASAAAEADAIIATAKEEALFVRAEAEREALRLTGDAKRDREETIRASRMEADQIVEAARTESDGVLAAAAQQAELAQERARALEDRRAELLSELEATRASISDLEQEIDSRRKELEEPEPEPEPEDARSHHTPDGGSVRIVASSSVVELEPVDAEEFVAEVEALRATDPSDESVTVVPASAQATPEPAPEPVIESTIRAVPAAAAEIVDHTPEPPPVIDDGPEPEVHAEPETAEPETAEPEATEAVDGPAPAADDESSVDESTDVTTELDAVAVPDDLGALFAQLREPASAPAEVEAIAAAEPVAEVADEAVDDDPADTTPEPATTSEADPVAEEVPTTDAGALAAQNAALRTIKRSLVDLQNETLEHLRTDQAWSPDQGFTDRFTDPFAEMQAALGDSVDSGAASAFGADLHHALTAALVHAREAGSGDREVAAAASKVFRTWRSDEAERRVFGAVTAVS